MCAHTNQHRHVQCTGKQHVQCYLQSGAAVQFSIILLHVGKLLYVCVCVCVRERVSVCVCVCVRERECCVCVTDLLDQQCLACPWWPVEQNGTWRSTQTCEATHTCAHTACVTSVCCCADLILRVSLCLRPHAGNCTADLQTGMLHRQENSLAQLLLDIPAYATHANLFSLSACVRTYVCPTLGPVCSAYTHSSPAMSSRLPVTGWLHCSTMASRSDFFCATGSEAACRKGTGRGGRPQSGATDRLACGAPCGACSPTHCWRRGAGSDWHVLCRWPCIVWGSRDVVRWV